MSKKSILFVCLGNICRSPLAHGVFEKLLSEAGKDDVLVDSCGTGSWHIGNAPHPGSCSIAEQHGISLADQRSRKLRVSDFDEFDVIVAMDKDNMRVLNQNKGNSKADIFMLRDFDEVEPGACVPDPYYTDTFENVYEIIERSCQNLYSKHFK